MLDPKKLAACGISDNEGYEKWLSSEEDIDKKITLTYMQRGVYSTAVGEIYGITPSRVRGTAAKCKRRYFTDLLISLSQPFNNLKLLEQGIEDSDDFHKFLIKGDSISSDIACTLIYFSDKAVPSDCQKFFGYSEYSGASRAAKIAKRYMDAKCIEELTGLSHRARMAILKSGYKLSDLESFYVSEGHLPDSMKIGGLTEREVTAFIADRVGVEYNPDRDWLKIFTDPVRNKLANLNVSDECVKEHIDKYGVLPSKLNLGKSLALKLYNYVTGNPHPITEGSVYVQDEDGVVYDNSGEGIRDYNSLTIIVNSIKDNGKSLKILPFK